MSILRIAHIGDSHFDEKNRLSDNITVHEAFLDQAAREAVHLIVHPGDFFERRSTGTERRAMREFLTSAAEIAPVVGCRGNHEADDEDLEGFNHLATKHPVIIANRPMGPDEMGYIDMGPCKVGVLALPWFTKAYIAARLPADTPAAETTERTIAAARGLLTMFGVNAAAMISNGRIPVFLGHLLAAGSETSTGQTLIGTTVELSPADILEMGCAYAALAHIHKAQSWHDGRVAYSGSPQRMNFGEPEAKGWNLVTIDTERWREPGGVTVEFRELPARAILLCERDWTDSDSFSIHMALGEMLGNVGNVAGGLLRLRYRIKPEDLHLVDEAKITADLLAAGAHSVKIEAVLVHQDRVRCAEIATATETKEKVAAYWLSKGMDIPDATRARVFAKLEEIEARRAMAL